MKHTLIKALLVILFIAFILTILTIYFRDSINTYLQNRFNPIVYNNPAITSNVAIPTPTPTISNLQVKSSDAKLTLTMQSKNLNNMTTYSFFVSSNSAIPEKPIFTKTVNSTATMTIPGNSWSADNKYFYLQEDNQGLLSIYLFKATGEPFTDGENYYDVTARFAKLASAYTFLEATGWASETLLVINTVNTSDPKTRGVSYWFEAPSTNFIPLATKF